MTWSMKKRLDAAKKNANNKRVGVFDLYRLSCRQTTLITNVKKEILPAEKIRKTYYRRWQIELVFKTWKFFFELKTETDEQEAYGMPIIE